MKLETICGERVLGSAGEAGFSPRIVMELDHVAASLSGFTGAKIIWRKTDS